METVRITMKTGGAYYTHKANPPPGRCSHFEAKSRNYAPEGHLDTRRLDMV